VSASSDPALLEKLQVDGRKVVDQITTASALIDLDYRVAMGVLNDRLWPYCHAIKNGPAHDFLELQLMNAKEDLGDLTSPWGYKWGPDRDRLIATNEVSEARRIVSTLEKYLAEDIPADAAKAKELRWHLVGLAALLDEAAHRCGEARE